MYLQFGHDQTSEPELSLDALDYGSEESVGAVLGGRGAEEAVLSEDAFDGHVVA